MLFRSLPQIHRTANVNLPAWDAANLVHAGSVWWRLRCHSQYLPTRNRVDTYNDTIVLFCQLVRNLLATVVYHSVAVPIQQFIICVCPRSSASNSFAADC